NVGEAEEMAVRAEAARVIHVVDHELRFAPSFRKFCRLVREGYCGRLQYARVHWAYGNRATPEVAWDWWSDDEKGGGILRAVGSHVIDFLPCCLGEVGAVGATLRTFVTHRPDKETGKPRQVETDDYALL